MTTVRSVSGHYGERPSEVPVPYCREASRDSHVRGCGLDISLLEDWERGETIWSDQYLDGIVTLREMIFFCLFAVCLLLYVREIWTCFSPSGKEPRERERGSFVVGGLEWMGAGGEGRLQSIRKSCGFPAFFYTINPSKKHIYSVYLWTCKIGLLKEHFHEIIPFLWAVEPEFSILFKLKKLF